jgi:hypothetical protein
MKLYEEGKLDGKKKSLSDAAGSWNQQADLVIGDILLHEGRARCLYSILQETLDPAKTEPLPFIFSMLQVVLSTLPLQENLFRNIRGGYYLQRILTSCWPKEIHLPSDSDYIF